MNKDVWVDWECEEEVSYNGVRYKVLSKKPSTEGGYEITLYPIREPENITVNFTVGETP